MKDEYDDLDDIVDENDESDNEELELELTHDNKDDDRALQDDDGNVKDEDETGNLSACPDFTWRHAVGELPVLHQYTGNLACMF